MGATGCSVKTACPYCGVGCGVLATPQDDGSVSIAGDPDHPANFGRLCSKGSALGETLSLDDRLLHPEINGARASWDDALDLAATRFSETIAQHGPDSVALYISGQLLTEDYYVANKLMKGFIGSGNIDTNSRLCMASSVAGHRRAFGSDTVPGVYADLEEADLVVLVGSNLAWCHPILYQRLVAARETRGTKVVVIDPRETASCEIADVHLAIAPDGDVAVFLGLLAHLEQSGQIDRDYVEAHTSGALAALDVARKLSREEIARAAGVDAAQLVKFFALWASTEKVVTCYSQGVNQSTSGSDKVNAIINCHLFTGRIGRPGMGPFSLTGQPNAMGGREVGGLANMLAAHMQIENPQDRARVQGFWASPVIADKPGLKAVDMFQAVADGRIKAIWIICTNPVVSMPDADSVRAALESCPFVVVSDVIRETDTTALAHVLLPATAWGEKDGTVTNSERRITRQRAFLPPPGQTRHDWKMICDVAARMGFADAFAFENAAAIFREHAALSAHENNGARDFDIGALERVSDEQFNALAPVQWPQRKGEEAPETRFFAHGGFFTPDRKGRFVPTPLPLQAARDGLTLNTGRLRDQWHTMTRTGKTGRLMAHAPEPFCEMHPMDAQAVGVMDGGLVVVASQRGEIIVRAKITSRQSRGSVFVPMHWTSRFASKARVDALAMPATDPVSGQPALKHTPCSVRAFAGAWHGFAVCAARPAPDCAYWAVAPVEGGFRLELAGSEPCPDWKSFAGAVFGLTNADEPEWVAYSDRATGAVRLAAFAGEALVGAIFVGAGAARISRNFLSQSLNAPHGPEARVRLLAGRPAQSTADDGYTICSCYSVASGIIIREIGNGADSVQAIGAKLKAGTNCGSCRSELQRMIHEHRLAEAI
ncbi:MAG: molybdopterin-dependent oxidoreductase [Beijerinckiaceae bacterium]|nr:molybdopterin-dependent oxidoreductase [Beijerinckiaceae bacterium]